MKSDRNSGALRVEGSPATTSAPTAGQAESERPEVPYQRAGSGAEGVCYAFCHWSPPACLAGGMAVVLGAPFLAAGVLLVAAHSSVPVGCGWGAPAPPTGRKYPTRGGTTSTMPRRWNAGGFPFSVDR